MNADPDHEDNLYDAARRLESEEARRAFLDQVCASDPAMGRRLEDLLQAAPEADKFFSRPAVDLERLPPLSPGEAAFPHLPSEQAGERIGRYKLLQPIGQGGFGTVWMAEQIEPVTRRVALKIIKAGMDTHEVIARFEAERQALAMMDHPNIAKVFDAGATDNSRPFFVMELVKGVPVTAYCDEAQLGTRQRLALFGDICSAIEHAHQKGIIHRDIKPSNVMVTLHGDRAVVKVIDFGIAKATEGKLTDKTLFTRFEQFVGTPVYMSPEQAAGSGLDLDTRSDIYALGILLYELLTGKPPFDAKSLISAGYDEMRRIIREVDPPKPSTRLKQEQSAPHPIGSPNSALRIPHSAIEPDLDWIVMKAIEKDRARRYGTASGLAEDIQRFLADEPVSARPPGAGYRFRKWVRRNKVVFAAGSAVAAALVMGLSLSTWLYFKERTARREANEAGRRLQRQLYAADMNLAKVAWDEAQVSTVLQLLRRYLPQPGEPDLRSFEWYYLERLCRSDLLTLKSRAGALNNVVFSPDGYYLASGGHHSTLLVWNAATGEETFAQRGTAAWVHHVTFSPNGKLLASSTGGANERGEVTVREAGTGKEVTSMKGLSGSIRSLAFNPDGTRLAMASPDGAEVRDIASGQVLLTLTGHHGPVHGVAFSPNGERLATAGDDKSVKVWDAGNGNLLLTCHGHSHLVSVVVFSMDGGTLASASHDQTAKLWNAVTGQEIRTLKGHSYHVLSVAFNHDGTRLATASDDRTVKLWDAATGEEISTLQGHTNVVRSAVFSPDGTRVASSSADGTVKIWNATGAQESLTMQGAPWRGYGVAFHPDGKKLASAHWDGTVKEWNAASGEVTHTFPAQPPGGKGDFGWVEAIAYSPDGTRILSGCDDAPLRIRDAVSGEELLTLKGPTAKVRCAAWSPDGNLVASGGNDFTVRVWDASNGRETLTLHGHTNNVLSMAFRSDGKRLASASNDHTVRVWDMATGQELRVLKGHRTGVKGVAWSPDGEQLATAGYDETVRLWDAASGREIHALTGHSDSVFALAFSPDGKRVASGGSADRAIKLWDVASGQETLTLKAHDDIVTGLAFSPDGRRLASAGWDKKVKVWDAHEPEPPAASPAAFWQEYDESKARPGGR